MFICLFCAWFGARAAQPFVRAAELRDENDALEREWKQLSLENQRLERDIKLLGTRDGVLQEARKHGFVLPNEYRLRIPEK